MKACPVCNGKGWIQARPEDRFYVRAYAGRMCEECKGTGIENEAKHAFMSTKIIACMSAGRECNACDELTCMFNESERGNNVK